MDKSALEKMEGALAEKLAGAFALVIEQKAAYYQEHPGCQHAVADLESLIQSVARTNAGISAGSNLVPGPWGMLAVVPEVILVTRNQIGLVYDIAMAYDRKDLLDQKNLGKLMALGLGADSNELSTEDLFEKCIAQIGSMLAQRLLKSALSKWLPVVGAAAMATSSHLMTRQIGLHAKEYLANSQNECPKKPVKKAHKEQGLHEFYRLRLLAGLQLMDGKNPESGQKFLQGLLVHSSLSDKQKAQLGEDMRDGSARKCQGLDVLAQDREESLLLLCDMVALAKADGEFYVTERLYIQQVATQLGYSDRDIDELLHK